MSRPRWHKAHADAIRAGAPRYVDPETGLEVATELAHRERGWCCRSICRHCPWGYEGGMSEATPPDPDQ